MENEMKKTYNIPTLKVVKIHTACILAGSPGLTGTYNGGTVLSRQDRGSFWDDEEEEQALPWPSQGVINNN